jgi:Peptidase family M1 domain
MLPRIWRWALVAIAVPGLAAPATATALTRTDYDALTAHLFDAAQPIPTGGLTWRIDVAEWSLDSGTMRLQGGPGGTVTGLWFQGAGALRLPVPDPVELRQLRRFLGDPGIAALDVTFDRMLLRASGGPPTARLDLPAPGGTPIPEVEERHDHYLRMRLLDVDARVLAALAAPGAQYWQADIHTADRGWLTVTYDSLRREELSVQYFDAQHSYVESWLSLDRTEDRDAAGRPAGPRDPLFELDHVDIAARLVDAARKFPTFLHAEFDVRVDVVVRKDSSALPFSLRNRAEVTAVRDAEGRDLEFVRDHIGARSNAIDKDVYDDLLLVLLPETQHRGAKLSLRVLYELDMPKYAGGRDWYPAPLDGSLHDRHTARLEMTTDDRHELQAMGQRVEATEHDGLKTSVWEVVQPEKMITFALQRTNYTKELDFDGLPAVTTVGDLNSGLRLLSEGRIDAVAADTVNSLNYLQSLLASPLPDAHFYAALIPAVHGQAFAGFLHLGEFTAALDTPAAVERFRAHEVAHQWWGHLVGWDSYRDQWLSESFAEYVALMFVQTTVDGGDKIFKEAITAYGREVRGSLESSFSSFARPDYSRLSALGAARMGPIGLGWRASVAEAPSAYSTLAYYKGALVLHMLRTATRLMTGSDQAFVDILRDFVHTEQGGYATTEDFRAAVERRVPADWSWFFDEWVYGAEIPTYVWSQEVVRGNGGLQLRLTVEQKDVGPGFRMLVPVRIDLGGGQEAEVGVFVDEPVETFELPLPSKPRKVEFNAGDAVIANVRKH